MSSNIFSSVSCKVLPDIVVFTASENTDLRGGVFTSYLEDIVRPHLPTSVDFVHDKFVHSKKNVIRGLHGDYKTWKLVTCVYGEVFQIVVDYRPSSPTYMKWASFHLNSQSHNSLLVPPEFANGFCSLSSHSVYHYKLAYNGEYNDAENQFVILWNHPQLAIPWPVSNPILSKRDGG